MSTMRVLALTLAGSRDCSTADPVRSAAANRSKPTARFRNPSAAVELPPRRADRVACRERLGTFVLRFGFTLKLQAPSRVIRGFAPDLRFEARGSPALTLQRL